MLYDYLIVGAGVFGSTFARLATDDGKRCLVIDKRNHIAGNCYTEHKDGINIHKYGPHIFHTSNEKIWEFVNRFSKFNNFILSPKAYNNGKIYSLPFNMNTFYELWGTITPEEAKEKISSQIFNGDVNNLEDYALNHVGSDIYNILIKGYTQKQWKRDPKYLPSSIIKRLPLRFTYDNNYFNDTYQGIPIDGYTKMFENILDGIEVRLNIDYFSDKDYWNSIANNVVYSGCIDEFFDYKFGKLQYRSLEFKTKFLEQNNFQGCAVMNYSESSIPYTRIIEHKHFEFGNQPHTYITFEYPTEYENNNIPCYPINDTINQKIFNQYEEYSKQTNTIFGGRLANYQYYDMHQVFGQAISIYNKHIKVKND